MPTIQWFSRGRFPEREWVGQRASTLLRLMKSLPDFPQEAPDQAHVTGVQESWSDNQHAKEQTQQKRICRAKEHRVTLHHQEGTAPYIHLLALKLPFRAKEGDDTKHTRQLLWPLGIFFLHTESVGVAPGQMQPQPLPRIRRLQLRGIPK